MPKIVVAVLLASVAALSVAQEKPQATRLQCQGTFTSFAPQLGDVSVSGIYVEVSEDNIKVVGAMGFDSIYSVVSRREEGIGFRLNSDPAYEGFLNRFSGELSLSQKGKAKDGSPSYLKLIKATCSNAHALF